MKGEGEIGKGRKERGREGKLELSVEGGVEKGEREDTEGVRWS